MSCIYDIKVADVLLAFKKIVFFAWHSQMRIFLEMALIYKCLQRIFIGYSRTHISIVKFKTS